MRAILAGAFLGLGLAVSASAADIPIVNPSFETPDIGPASFDVNSAPFGWTQFGTIDAGNRSVGVLNPAETTLYTGVPHGDNVGVIFLYNAGGGNTYDNSPAGLQQTLVDTLQLQTSYTLTVSVGNIAVNTPGESFPFTGFPGYRIDLLAGGVILASDVNTLLPGEGSFLTSTVSFVTGSSHAQAGQPLGIRLTNLDAGPGLEVNFDNLLLTATAIPEPVSAAWLGGAALAGFVAWRRRERAIRA